MSLQCVLRSLEKIGETLGTFRTITYNNEIDVVLKMCTLTTRKQDSKMTEEFIYLPQKKNKN